MVACLRCARSQKECRLSSLSQKCAECIRTGRKCEPAEPAVNFAGIDKALEKLEREELETEAAWEAAVELARVKQSKLKRLRQQRRFLKEREQKMFEKGLSDVEELERLEELEKVAEIGVTLAGSSSLDELLSPSALSPGTLNWLTSGGIDEVPLGSSQDS